VYPCLALFTLSLMPPEDQAVTAGAYNCMGQLGRAIGLALATAIELAVENSEVDKEITSDALLKGIRSAQWFSVGLGLLAICGILGWLRKIGKVGAKKS